MTSPNTLSAAITNAIRYELMNIHTAFPAKIVSYDYTTRKASVQPQVDKKYTDGTVQPLPQINNIPVVMPQVGDFYMNFPINAGDSCLVVCCERSISSWLRTGQQAPPVDTRKLDLSDAVAIMGLRPFTEQSPAANNTDFVIGFGGSEIKIDPTGNVTIKTANRIAIGGSNILGTVEVLKIISDTLEILKNSLTTAPGTPIAGGGPLPLGLYAILQQQLESIRGTLT